MDGWNGMEGPAHEWNPEWNGMDDRHHECAKIEMLSVPRTTLIVTVLFRYDGAGNAKSLKHSRAHWPLAITGIAGPVWFGWLQPPVPVWSSKEGQHRLTLQW